MRYPGWLLTSIALAGVVLTLSAAYWQFGRAEQKTALRQDYQTRQNMPAIDLNTTLPETGIIAFRKVRVTGTYLPDKAIILDNRIRQGGAGYEIIVPFRIGDTGRTVLINRGWVARSRSRANLPQIVLPHGTLTVAGSAAVPGPGALELSRETVEGMVWQNLHLERYRERQGLDVLDFVIQEESESADGLDRSWPEPGFGVRTHQSYAAQWLLFAALIVFFYVYYGFVRKRTTTEK